MSQDQFAVLRTRMVEVIAAHALHAGEQSGRDQLDGRVLAAMEQVRRHDFVPAELRAYAYFDTPLPIGFDKTVSQPFIVALMTDLMELTPDDRVLEVGTGLGYHAAILSHLVAQVFSVEIVEELGLKAQANLKRLERDNVEVRIGDGGRGWPDKGPFDAICVAAAPDLLPPLLIGQLKPGGRMVCPSGIPGDQKLLLARKDDAGKLSVTEILPVNFSELETGH